ncbi:TetR/AcrR family transcriptional regulator [Nocardioides marmotae]|uniref:TetR/AcrR family transcriptional regulator n=1 Tax=Nocardioides marmotae TaxID=2663857 RepID=UPI0012B5E900|nr:TetR/AcrR family transcriptional regulator [Nocardioides marmotae]QKE00056.1 TetR/AcrR family transcriptional regulator [Nocardioides marmotae]
MAASQKSKRSRDDQSTLRKRHAEVVAAASKVFYAKGYEGTTIQDIADELGILKGSVYYYITSKEEVLYEVLQDVHAAGLEALREASEVEGDPLERIRSVVSTLSEFNAKHRVRMAILLRELQVLDPKRRREIVAERDHYEEVLRGLIEEAQEAGLADPDLDPKITTRAIMGMINTIYQWYRPSGGLKPASIGAQYADLAVRAVASR